ncbi:hypothetical protein, partial [Blautia obeum]|uniref:hypothetical protein n=1 Tax=Blautia obeum TaxID=40520 RepID=UPI001A9AA07C
MESEGKWQISGLTNRNHIRLLLRIRPPNKPKSNNCSELTIVNVADIWGERNVWYRTVRTAVSMRGRELITPFLLDYLLLLITSLAISASSPAD